MNHATFAAVGFDISALVALRHHDAHPRLDVQEQRIAACGDRGVVDAHPLNAGTNVLAVSGAPVAQASDRLLSSTRCHISVTRACLSNKKTAPFGAAEMSAGD